MSEGGHPSIHPFSTAKIGGEHANSTQKIPELELNIGPSCYEETVLTTALLRCPKEAIIKPKINLSK